MTRHGTQMIIMLLAAFNTAFTAYTPEGYVYEIPEIPVDLNKQIASKELITVYEAQNLEFGFPNEEERKLALDSGNYKPDSVIPIDVDVYYGNGEAHKVFLTIPRFEKGVPYSLAYLTDVVKPNGSEIQPYPSYEWHNSYGRNCNGLTSVCRVQIDSCGQMWILDSGEIGFEQFCPPNLAVIDLHTNQLIHRYYLPQQVYKARLSRFVTPLVDIADPAPQGDCKSAFVYMADSNGFGIVVYDVNNNQSWRIENKYTYPDPDFATHSIAGKSYELLEGVAALTVTPPGLPGIERMLFFHALANDIEMAVPLSIVNNASLWKNSRDLANGLDRFTVLGKRGVPCIASAMSAMGFQFCGFLKPVGIISWNIRQPYITQNLKVVAENPETLQFVSGLKIIKNYRGKEELWMLSNRIQNAFTGSTNFKEINYRILRCGVEELLEGKSCIL